MKKRFLPFSLLVVIMVFAQSLMAGPSVIKDGDNSIYWRSLGPSNMGGRATSVIFDNQVPSHVYIGSMGGGVFYSWNSGITWHQVGDDLMVSCLAQGSDGTIYVGTGDGCNAVDYNGFADLGYENSFIGTGLYMIKNGNMEPVPSTTPTVLNDVTEWSFINDVAVCGDKVIVATENGVKYISVSEIGNAGATWSYAKVNGEDLVGFAHEVKVASDNTVLASVDGALYIGSLDAMECRSDVVEGKLESLPVAEGLLDIAVAPSDPNVIYAACINASGNHQSVYLSEDQGQTWRVIVPLIQETFGHQLYESRGLYNHGITVNPTNPYSAYVMGYNLWRMDRSELNPNGFYLTVKQSDGDNSIIFLDTYLHSGVNAMTFDPRNANSAYVATDGGIFKAQLNNTMYPTYANCNRGFTTARAFNVAPSGKISRVVAGLMDHGPILIEGEEGTNHDGSAVPLYPNNDPSVYGAFSDTYHAGSCAVSTINPDVFFLTTRDGALQRTESAGVDYDASNFSGVTFSFTGYRMPIALWESYNYSQSVDKVWFKCKQNQHAGDVVKCYSSNASYPFDYTLPVDMHYNANNPQLSDSIQVKDPIAAKFYVADGSALYFTRDALKFNKSASWFKLATLDDAASCITTSADGDVVLVGTRSGSIVRVKNMKAAVDDSTSNPSASQFAPVATVIELPVEGQYVTSIALSSNNKEMIVTLGNYGNETYVLYSTNADADEPTFVSKQGDLDPMPVYSSIIEMTTGDIFLGTEHGIYKAENINEGKWVKADANMGDVPVMELKQQTIYKADQMVPMYVDTTVVMVPFAGTNNQGVIYAATYGKGLYRCDTYRLHSGNNVPETPMVNVNSKVEIYPNPVRESAMIRFDLSQTASVSYQVYDMTGRLVKVENMGNLMEGEYELNISVDGLSAGSYVLRLNAGNSTSSAKFMVQ